MTDSRHAAMIDAALDAIVSIDAHGVIVEFNKAAQEIFGYDEREAIGREMVELIVPPDLREPHRQGFRRHLRDGSTVVLGQRIEIVAQRRGGTVFPVELSITRSDHDVQPIFTAWVRDISDRLEREAELKETSGRLWALISNLGSGVLVEDADRNIALANQELCDLFDIPVPPTDLVGADCEKAAEDLADLVATDRFLGRIEEILAADEVVRGEQITLVDGRTLERDFVPAYSEDELQGRLWIYRDVSDRVRAASDLVQMRDAALEASTTKSRFLATMSHELRTPLTGLTGLIDLLRQATLADDAQSIVRMMDESADHMLNVIGDILDISKIEAGMLDFSQSRFVPREEIAQCITLFTAKAEAKGLEMVARLDDSSLRAPVVGDVVRTRQIIQNLVSNAVKFTDTGMISVDASLVTDDDLELHRLTVMVSDTGVGLTEDEMSRLFEPFAQGEATYARQSGGTGLGLAICQRLAEGMGGHVEVRSELGVGSVFRLDLPVAPAPKDLPNSAAAPEESGRPTGSGGRVGVIEDSSLNREVIARLVEGLGYEVVTGSSGMDAVEIARESEIDVFLMDCRMPGMDGFEATSEIRQLLGDAARTPIIAMTASTLEQDRRRCAEAGMDDFLSKPLRRTQLEKTLSVWSARRSDQTSVDLEGDVRIDTLPLAELRSQLGDEAVRAIVRTFIDEASARVKRLDRAAALHDLELVSREAHTLKSSAAALGAVSMEASCEQLEDSCRNGDLDEDTLAAALRTVAQAIDHFSSDSTESAQTATARQGQ